MNSDEISARIHASGQFSPVEPARIERFQAAMTARGLAARTPAAKAKYAVAVEAAAEYVIEMNKWNDE